MNSQCLTWLEHKTWFFSNFGWKKWWINQSAYSSGPETSQGACLLLCSPFVYFLFNLLIITVILFCPVQSFSLACFSLRPFLLEIGNYYFIDNSLIWNLFISVLDSAIASWWIYLLYGPTIMHSSTRYQIYCFKALFYYFTSLERLWIGFPIK